MIQLQRPNATFRGITSLKSIERNNLWVTWVIVRCRWTVKQPPKLVFESCEPGLLRIPLSEFHQFEVVKGYCSMGSCLKDVQESVAKVDRARRLEGKATQLWGRAMLTAQTA